MAKQTCECCGRKTEKLVKHHWFEIPTLERKEKMVCLSCNALLQTSYLSSLPSQDHILTNWKNQVRYVHLVHKKRELEYTIQKELTEFNTMLYPRIPPQEIEGEREKIRKSSYKKWVVEKYRKWQRDHNVPVTYEKKDLGTRWS